MLAGSWVSFRCARYLVRDDRVYPFAMAVVVGFAVLIARGCGHAGSANVIDRDAQRLQSDLSAILARSHHH